MSYIKGLIEDMKEIDSLTDEMLELDLPWNERESMLHGDMVDAIDAYLTFLRQYVADGSRYERLQRPSAPKSKQSSGGAKRSQSSQCIKKKSSSGTAKKKSTGGSKKAQSSQCIKRNTAKGKTTKSTGSAQRRPTASRRRRCRAGTDTSSQTGL